MYYPLTLWQAENTALEEPDQFQIPKLNPRPKDEDEKHNKITEWRALWRAHPIPRCSKNERIKGG